MKQITPCLWFDNQAEEAARFYTSIFKNSKIGKIARYGEAGPGPKGSVMTVEFQINGQDYLGLNGGPMFQFNEAISLIVNCDTQEEIDYYWAKLTADGGREVQCGWLKDKFGLSWQVNPSIMDQLIDSGESARNDRVMKAMLGMVKMDIAALKAAYDGRA